MKDSFLIEKIKVISGKEKLIRRIEEELKTPFEKKLFEAAINNLFDAYNPLRFNNFAYAIRELIEIILRRLAPKDEVLQCSWYKNDTDCKNGITRRQRIIYSVQGGLSDEYVSETLEINRLKIQKDILDVVKNLNQHTHIDEKTFDISLDKQESYVNDTLSSFVDLFDTINELKSSISEKLIGVIEEELDNQGFVELINESLSSRSYLEKIFVEEYIIKDIDHANIYIKTKGDMDVKLEYGSKSDCDIKDATFPFSCHLVVSVSESEEIIRTEFFKIHNPMDEKEDEIHQLLEEEFFNQLLNDEQDSYELIRSSNNFDDDVPF